MTHLTMEQLLALREPGLEPGVQGWREHTAACEACRSELDRLDQRMARLRALPTLAPAHSRLAEVQQRVRNDRRRRRVFLVSLGGLALAATVALAVVLAPAPGSGPSATLSEQQELNDIIARSQSLEGAIEAYNPEQRVTDGRTAVVAASLEDQLARVDRQLQTVNLVDQRMRQQESLRLWRERVTLLNALVDVHVTRARAVGF